MMSLPITAQGMRKLESALSLYFNTNKSNKNARLSYSEFCKCVSKMVPALATGLGNAAVMSSLPDDSVLLQLSREERCWHDLYCVAVPALYTLDGAKGDLLLVPPTPGQNRYKEMARLAQVAVEEGVPEQKSQFAVDLLLSLRPKEKKSKMAAAVPVAKATNDAADSLLGIATDGTKPAPASATSVTNKHISTIEERIQARTKERERDMEQADAARKDPKDDQIAVVDLLYLYANQRLRFANKASRFQTSRNNNAAGRRALNVCSATFGDIVMNAIPDRSRKEINALFQGIVLSCPGTKFLKWHDPKSGRNGNPIGKEATVWIDPTDFQRVRAMLTGYHDCPM